MEHDTSSDPGCDGNFLTDDGEPAFYNASLINFSDQAAVEEKFNSLEPKIFVTSPNPTSSVASDTPQERIGTNKTSIGTPLRRSPRFPRRSARLGRRLQVSQGLKMSLYPTLLINEASLQSNQPLPL